MSIVNGVEVGYYIYIRIYGFVYIVMLCELEFVIFSIFSICRNCYYWNLIIEELGFERLRLFFKF